MLIIITQEVPPGGVDHKDAHRILGTLARPYAKRNEVAHNHINFGSILKVIYTIFNIDWGKQNDVTTSLRSDFFTGKPYYVPSITVAGQRMCQ